MSGLIPVAVNYDHPDNDYTTPYTVSLSVEAIGSILLPVMDALDGIDDLARIRSLAQSVQTAISGAL